MDKAYWIGREHASVAMARGAATSQARLIHFELAGRYGIKAVGSGPPEAGTEPDEESEKVVQPPRPAPARPGSIFRPFRPDRPTPAEPNG